MMVSSIILSSNFKNNQLWILSVSEDIHAVQQPLQSRRSNDTESPSSLRIMKWVLGELTCLICGAMLHLLTNDDSPRSIPGSPDTLWGEREVMITQQTRDNLILFSLQNRCVVSPTFTRQRLKIVDSLDA
jgi:hypothetical protein